MLSYNQGDDQRERSGFSSFPPGPAAAATRILPGLGALHPQRASILAPARALPGCAAGHLQKELRAAGAGATGRRGKEPGAHGAAGSQMAAAAVWCLRLQPDLCRGAGMCCLTLDRLLPSRAAPLLLLLLAPGTDISALAASPQPGPLPRQAGGRAVQEQVPPRARVSGLGGTSGGGLHLSGWATPQGTSWAFSFCKCMAHITSSLQLA